MVNTVTTQQAERRFDCQCFLYSTMLTSLGNRWIRQLNQQTKITTCKIKGVARDNEPTENPHPARQFPSAARLLQIKRDNTSESTC